MRMKAWIALLLTLCLLAGALPAALAEASEPAALEAVEAAVPERELSLEAENSLEPRMAGTGGWRKIDGSWYYFADGAAVTGWRQIDGHWYRLSNDGRMLTGWHREYGHWYYLKSDGAMAEGWRLIDGKWYYFAPGSGSMVTGWKSIGGVWYWFRSDGAMATGWQKLDGVWYYFTPDGAMAEGWKLIGGTWYYFIPNSGAMAANRWRLINGSWYYFDENGAMATGMWDIDGKTYLFSSGGAMAEGWRCPSGDNMKWLYFIPGSGEMAVNRWRLIDGSWYYFDRNGLMALEWEDIDGKRYYFGCDGKMVTGWYSDSYGTWYFLPSGEMARNTRVTINGEVYIFGKSGEVIGRGSAEPTANTQDLAFLFDLDPLERYEKLKSMGWDISSETQEDGTHYYSVFKGFDDSYVYLRWNDDESEPYCYLEIDGAREPSLTYSLAGVTANMTFWQAAAVLEEAGWTSTWYYNPESASVQRRALHYAKTRSGMRLIFTVTSQDGVDISNIWMMIDWPSE